MNFILIYKESSRSPRFSCIMYRKEHRFDGTLVLYALIILKNSEPFYNGGSCFKYWRNETFDNMTKIKKGLSSWVFQTSVYKVFLYNTEPV